MKVKCVMTTHMISCKITLTSSKDGRILKSWENEAKTLPDIKSIAYKISGEVWADYRNHNPKDFPLICKIRIYFSERKKMFRDEFLIEYMRTKHVNATIRKTVDNLLGGNNYE